MDIQKLSSGTFLLSSPYGQRYLTFFSPSIFRLSETLNNESDIVERPSPYTGYIDVKDNIFILAKSELSIDDAFGLRVLYRGEQVLNLGLLSASQSDNGTLLAALEGHKAELKGECIGGFVIENDRPVYGLGERTGPLDKRGYDYINWNTDDPSAHVDTYKSLYQSVPFFILHGERCDVGVFLDNASKTYFDINKTDPKAVRVEYEGGAFDLYVFLGTMPKVIEGYTRLTGRSPLPPYWSLGAQQSRWSYFDKAEVDAVIRGYRDADIPLSCVYLDIDYMDAYKDFTVNEIKFPDVVSWLSSLKGQDIHVVPIIDAGVKAEPGYFLFDEGMGQGYFSTLHGEVYHNEVWPGDSVFPAFLDPKVREWWSKHIEVFLNLGFSGIWNDMNEPASFKGPLPLDVEMGNGRLHKDVHNLYGHSMAKAGAMGFERVGKRLFQLTRAGFAGTNHYSFSWAGDNQSIYEHMRLSLPQMMNMSLSGQNYIGVDIGGFGGDATPELLCKWAVASLFNPLYRNHSSLGTKMQEPYRLEGPYLDAYRKAVKLRYELIPALYDLLFEGEMNGSLAVRPLVYNYPKDVNVFNENTEVMLGDSLLLAPSLFPGQTHRSAYFPEPFIDVFTGMRYDKGNHLVDCGLGDIPLFVKEKGLVVLSKPKLNKAVPSDTLRLLWGGKKASAHHYEDEGDGLGYRRGEYNHYLITVEHGRVRISYKHHGFPTRYRKVILERPGKKPLECSFDPKG